MITLKEINNQNLIVVENLLLERNITIPEYVHWKYEQNDDSFRGAIAFVDGEPAGCFGLIPRELKINSSKTVMCGWFADWYVSPRFRGLKIGQNLLNEISEVYPITFGHPGPAAAQKICKKNGYKEIVFQSRRRMMIHPWHYARFRTRNPFKIMALGLPNTLRFNLQNVITEDRQSLTDESTFEDWISFIDDTAYQDWIYSQPCSSSMATREWKKWEDDDLRIFYTIDHLMTGERRSLVLHFDGSSIYSMRAWRKFIIFIHKIGVIYVDIFTTNPKIDQIWMSMGAKRIIESPVLVKNLQAETQLDLHGWDRENWTFLASRRE